MSVLFGYYNSLSIIGFLNDLFKKLNMEENINQLIQLFQGADISHLLEEHHDEIQPIVERYLSLKAMAGNMGPEVTSDPVFRHNYCYFYGMSRYTDQNYRNIYFETMRRCMEHPDQIDLTQLLQSLRNTFANKVRIEMSFVSKMMNFVDDNRYPIYDSGIREAFGFRIPSGVVAKMAYYPEMYNAIIAAYEALSNHPSIDFFRQSFNCPDLPAFRILDFINISIIRNG